jgi:hypothetical protein
MKDLLLNFTNKTIFANGDIKTGESDQQHQNLLIVCAKGSFKEFPATCVGANEFLENEDAAGFLREVRTQFTNDGMTVNKIVFEDNKLKVDANY